MQASLQPAKPRQQGFTLLEVMTVVAVIGILSAIAWPSYNAYMRRSHRADARAGLLQAQQWMQRAATTGNYPTSLPDALSWATDGKKRYDIGFLTLPSSTTPGYVLKATPRSGPQADDECGDLTLDHTGKPGVLNATAAKGVAYCWNR